MLLHLRRRYFEIDPRTLGVLRIALAGYLLFDLAKRSLGLDNWYVDSGFLPNHRLLWRPGPYGFSFLLSLWTPGQVQVAFAIIGSIYVCLLLGFHTRVSHVLSWLCLLSLHTRTHFLLNGGDYVLCGLLLWSCFLPLGRRYSVDALRADQVHARDAPIRSLAVLALLLQLSVIYLFSALNKDGPTWQDGSAVHYLLHQARIVTPLGLWARDHLPSKVLAGMTYWTLIIEYVLPVLILCPVFGAWPRRLAILCIWQLHGGIALFSDVGVFSAAMMLFSLVLLSREDHEALARLTWPRRVAGQARDQVAALLEHLRVRDSAPRAARLTPLGARIAHGCAYLREACVALLLLCACSQLIVENVRHFVWLTHAQPELVRATISYLHLNQGWAMFAPDAPKRDMWIVVDAETYRGQHLDPYNEQASLIADPALRQIPERLGQNVFFCNFTARIVGNPHFQQAFQEWVFNRAPPTAKIEQRIRSFKAYIVENDSPPPGETKPTNTRVVEFLAAERPR